MTNNSLSFSTIMDAKCIFCNKKLGEHTEKDVECGLRAELTAKCITLSIPNYNKQQGDSVK